MNINPMLTRAAVVGTEFGYAGPDAAVLGAAGLGNGAVFGAAGQGNAAVAPVRRRSMWAPTATAAWTVQPSRAAVGTAAFSAHHVSLKRSPLPREVLCLT